MYIPGGNKNSHDWSHQRLKSREFEENVNIADDRRSNFRMWTGGNENRAGEIRRIRSDGGWGALGAEIEPHFILFLVPVH